MGYVNLNSLFHKYPKCLYDYSFPRHFFRYVLMQVQEAKIKKKGFHNLRRLLRGIQGSMNTFIEPLIMQTNLTHIIFVQFFHSS